MHQVLNDGDTQTPEMSQELCRLSQGTSDIEALLYTVSRLLT
jgi:hypothetical protein